MAAISTTGNPCLDGSYSAGEECSPCSQSSTTCNGPSSKDFIVCVSKFQGRRCVAVGTDGVCTGTGGDDRGQNKLEGHGEIKIF